VAKSSQGLCDQIPRSVLSHHSLPRATTWGLLFWTDQRPRPNCLGPITNQAQMRHLTVYSQHTPSLRGGCTEQLRPVQTDCNVSLPTFPQIFLWRLNFPRFHNHRTHVCHYNGSAFTHLYIKGTPRSPQGRISLTSKPPFLTSTDLRVRVSAGTNPSAVPVLKLTHFHHQQPPH